MLSPTTCLEPDSVDRAALQKALQDFSSAFLAADAQALDTLLAADYLHTNGGTGAVLTKAEWLDYIRARRADLRAGRLRVHRYETTDMVIRWYSGAAVVSGRVFAEGRRNGAAFSSRLQVTQLWIRTGDRWRRAAFHDSPVPQS